MILAVTEFPGSKGDLLSVMRGHSADRAALFCGSLILGFHTPLSIILDIPRIGAAGLYVIHTVFSLHPPKY